MCESETTECHTTPGQRALAAIAGICSLLVGFYAAMCLFMYVAGSHWSEFLGASNTDLMLTAAVWGGIVALFGSVGYRIALYVVAGSEFPRFTLRMALAALVVAALAFGWGTNYVQRKRTADLKKQAIAEIEQQGGSIEREYDGALTIDISNIYWADLATLVSRFENVRNLSVSNTRIKDDGLAAIAKHTELQSLDLSRNRRFTDIGVSHLSNLTNLEVLDLSSTKITDEAIVHLVKLQKLKKLDTLGSKVTEEGRERLRKTFPDCLLR